MSGSHAAAHRRARPLRLAAGGAVVVVVAGIGALVARLTATPTVALASSKQALVNVQLGGLGSGLQQVRAMDHGEPVALVRAAGGLMPAKPLSQGERVRLTATASPPSWLGWLLGGAVTRTATVQAPIVSPTSTLAVTHTPGEVPVAFDQPVSVVSYRAPGQPVRTMRLQRPAGLVDLRVPNAAAGSLEVAAAASTWEQVAAKPATVSWVVHRRGAAPEVLATPAPGATATAPNGTVTLRFTEPVSKVLGKTRPKLSPAVPGRWSQPNRDTLVFQPTGLGFGPSATVTATFDRAVSVLGTSGAASSGAKPATTYQFSTAPGSLLRLEQILAQLHYLPLNFTPAAGTTIPTTLDGEVATLTHPLPGNFSWRWANTPATLQTTWSPGSPSLMVKGALMTFVADHSQQYDGYTAEGESVAQLASPSTWQALLQAAATNAVDPHPYSYVYVTKTLPETLTLWENGTVALTAPANTGIPQDPTADGTYPVYLRFTVNQMKGTNPNGTPYNDTVYWINYFNGSDAVHGFPRATYGSPQSLGCVELPIPTAATAFSDLAIGDLVTVAN